MAVFETTKSTAEAKALIEFALPLMGAEGTIPWSKVEAHFGWHSNDDGTYNGIGYSRGWLIVRRAWLEAHAPEAIVDWPTLRAAAEKRYKGNFNEALHLFTPVAVALRDKQQLSWGEIAVRMSMPESRARKYYKAGGLRKDLGLRIGKGGRYAYDDQALYEGERIREGAHIPVDLKGRPAPTDLLNYKPEDEPKRASA